MQRQRVIAVFTVTGERNNLCSAGAQNLLHGQGGTAGAENKRLFSGADAAVTGKQPRKTVIIGIVAVERAVCTPQKRVHAAHAPCRFRKLRAKRNNRFFIGNRYI